MLFPFLLQANPIKDPKRVVNAQTVDLKPLFTWWKHHGSERPLTSWVHLTAKVVGTNAWGWIVQAQLDESASNKNRKHQQGDNEKIILKNPPTQEYSAFLNFQAQLRTLNAEHSLLSNQETRAKNRAKEVTPGRRGTRGRATIAQSRQAKQAEDEAKNQLKTVDKQIAAVKKQLAEFPNADHYTIDCFALDTDQEHGGLPVYDQGMAVR